MERFGRFRAFATALFLALTSHVVPAQGTEGDPFYVGVALGLTDFEDQYERSTYNETPGTLQAVFGYRIRRLWSIEATAQSLGEIDSPDRLGSGTDRFDISTQTDVLGLRARFTVPVSELYNLRRESALFGIIGIHQTSVHRDVVELNSGSAFREESDEIGVAVGAGLLWRMGKFRFRGALEWTDLDEEVGSVTSLTLGLEFNF